MAKCDTRIAEATFFFNKDKSHFNKTLYCCRHVLAYMFGAEQSL